MTGISTTTTAPHSALAFDDWEDNAELINDDSDLRTSINNSVAISSCCTCSSARKISHFLLSSAVFGTTTYFGVTELLGSGNITKLSLCALFQGASVASYGHLIFSPSHRKKINEFVSAWSYEFVLACSQVYLNLAPPAKMKLYALPFVWGLGVLSAKDVLTLTSLKLADLPLSAVPPPEEELLRTIGYTTRNSSVGAKVMLTGFAVSAIGLTVLNFVFKDNYSKMGDFGEIGLYQDLIALFSGSVMGDLVARVIDNYKEGKEARQAGLLISRETPAILKVLRVAKNAFVIFTPLSIGALLAAPTPPNSVADFAVKAGVGALYGGQMLVAKREFENPNSYLHTSVQISANEADAIVTTCEKVKLTVKKYLPSVVFFGALTAYMGVAAATNLPRADYAIAVLLFTTFASFIATDRISVINRPERNARLRNELSFRFIYSAIALSIYFQYLTTKLNIGDQNLDSDSTSLYILALVTWSFWGLNVGNNRAVNIQPRIPSTQSNTPPIAMQELSKTFVTNLQ